MKEDTIWNLFHRNWVFRLYSRTRSRYVLSILIGATLPLILWAVGAVSSLFFNSFYLFITNVSLYLNIFGISLALVSFAWFAHKLPSVLAYIRQVFDISKEEYERIIRKWANRIANRNFLLILCSIPFMILNLVETVAIWKSTQPPIFLEPWVRSSASNYFAVVYGFMHAVILPFLLGSGSVGLVGTLLLLIDLLSRPVILAYYRRLRVIIEMTAWLVMWALIALSSVLLFGRPFMLFRVDNPAVTVSGIVQSVIASILVISIGSIPLVQIHNAVSKAKRISLAHLELLLDQIYSWLLIYINTASTDLEGIGQKSLGQRDKPDDSALQMLYKRLDIVNALIKQVEEIPSVPISVASVLRVAFGAILSVGSSAFKLAQQMKWIQ